MKPLIESLEIRSFRGLKSATLENMGRFNLLVGENNSGKTSVLEAIMLFLRPGDVEQWLKLLNVRDIESADGKLGEAVSWLFPVVGRISPGQRQDLVLEGVTNGTNEALRLHYLHEAAMVIPEPPMSQLGEKEGFDAREEFEGRKNVVLLADWSSQTGGNKTGTMMFPDFSDGFEPPVMDDNIQLIRNYPVEFVKPHAHRLSAYALGSLTDDVLQKRKKLLIEVLQNFDPDITGVEIVEGRSGSIIVIVHRVLGAMPLHSYGDGVRKAFFVIEHALRAEGGVLIIDEAETALHVKAQEDFFRALLQLCMDLNVQIVATTHSLDTVDAVLKAVPDHDNNLVGYHLSVSEGTRKVKRYSGDQWERLRFERGLDIR